MPTSDRVTDTRLAALLQFYTRHWPAGELRWALEELQERRAQEKAKGDRN